MAFMTALMESHTSIAALLRADRGDQLVVARLLEACRPYLRLVARTNVNRALKGKADRSDVVHEAMLRAARDFSGIRGQSRGATYRLAAVIAGPIDHRFDAALPISCPSGYPRTIAQSNDRSVIRGTGYGRTAQSYADSLPSGAVAGVVIANALALLDDDSVTATRKALRIRRRSLTKRCLYST